jgi:hypothetical protein
MASKTPKYKNKKFYYRRAVWSGQKSKTLQDILTEAHLKLATTGQRTFSSSHGSEIKGANYEDNDGLYLQIASYVPGEPTSTIDKSKSSKTSNILAEPAPIGKDYLDGDIFVYIKGNNTILCPSGVRESVAQAYFYHILHSLGETEIACTLELDKIAKTSKIRMIKEEGVGEIDLSTSLYEASLIHMDKNNPKVSGVKRIIADQLTAIFSKDKSLSDIKSEENLNIKISIKFDGLEARKNLKNTNFGKSGRKRLEKTAEQIIKEFESDHEDGFTIITKKGNRITSDEIRVADLLRVKTLGKSLDKDSAWGRLKEYYERLNKDGIFKE